jgi:hypothetical protein
MEETAKKIDAINAKIKPLLTQKRAEMQKLTDAMSKEDRKEVQTASSIFTGTRGCAVKSIGEKTIPNWLNDFNSDEFTPAALMTHLKKRQSIEQKNGKPNFRVRLKSKKAKKNS